MTLLHEHQRRHLHQNHCHRRPIIAQLILLLALLSSVAFGAENFLPRHLVEFERIGSVSSFQDRYVVFSRWNYSTTDNSITQNLWLLDLNSNQLRPLTKASTTTRDFNPVWLSSTHVAFLSSGRSTNSIQDDKGIIWMMDIRQETPEIRQFATFPIPIDNLVFDLKTKLLMFTAAVYHDGSMSKAAEKNRKDSERFDTAMVFDELFVRHWDHYVSKSKNNLFTAAVAETRDGIPILPRETVTNVMKKTRFECPVEPFGDTSDFAISPDGKEIAFVARKPEQSQAWNTNTNVYLVPSDGTRKPQSITDYNRGYDTQPRYSPDGKYLAWLEMKTPQFEADRNRIVVMDRSTKKRRYVAPDWDRSPNAMTWSLDSNSFSLLPLNMGTQSCLLLTL